MPLLVHLALVLVQVLFATLAIGGRIVLRELPPGALALVRVGGATGFLLLANALGPARWVADRRDLARLAVLGLLGITANQGLFLFGLRHTTAVNATILVATIPVFTVLGSVLLRREPPSALKLAGIAAAGAGTVYLIGPDRLTFGAAAAVGNLLIVLGMVAYSVYLLQAKAVLKRYSPLTVSCYVMGFGTLGMLPVGLHGIARADLSAISPAVWWLTGYIVLFPTVAAYFLNIWALERASSNLVAVYIYLQPLFTAAVAPLVLAGEGLTARGAASGLAIFSGVALVVWAERRQAGEVPVQPLPGE